MYKYIREIVEKKIIIKRQDHSKLSFNYWLSPQIEVSGSDATSAFGYVVRTNCPQAVR